MASWVDSSIYLSIYLSYHNRGHFYVKLSKDDRNTATPFRLQGFRSRRGVERPHSRLLHLRVEIGAGRAAQTVRCACFGGPPDQLRGAPAMERRSVISLIPAMSLWAAGLASTPSFLTKSSIDRMKEGTLGRRVCRRGLAEVVLQFRTLS